MKTTIWQVLILLMLTGCSHYWYHSDSPKGTLEQFTKDHRECLETGSPIPNQPGYVLIEQSAFRSCLFLRGWRREAHNRGIVGPGHFRGVETFELRAIAVDKLPEQPDSASVDVTDPRYFIQPDAQRPPAPR